MRVLIIDDHALFRFGLEELLARRSIEVVAAVGDGKTGLEVAANTKLDIILLDMRMPGMTGLQVLRALRAQGSQVPVIILTTSSSESDVISTLRAGAQGYLLKDMDPDDLPRTLSRVVAGQTVVAPELASVLAGFIQGDSGERFSSEKPKLTPRESEILGHLAAGQSNKVIARDLGISEGTVKLHVKAILRKLGVRSRVEAAVLAVQNDWCKTPDT